MEPAETSGDDTSDDSSDEDSVEEALQIKPSKENSAKGISKVKDTKVAAAAAASDSNKAQGGGSRKGQTYKRYHGSVCFDTEECTFLVQLNKLQQPYSHNA